MGDHGNGVYERSQPRENVPARGKIAKGCLSPPFALSSNSACPSRTTPNDWELKVDVYETIRNDDFSTTQPCNIVPTLQRCVALNIVDANRPV